PHDQPAGAGEAPRSRAEHHRSVGPALHPELLGRRRAGDVGRRRQEEGHQRRHHGAQGHGARYGRRVGRAVGPARRAHARGLTLLEVLIVIALIALLGGTVMLGPGVLASSRVRSAATLIVSGVRLGATRANSTGRPTRLVIDIDERRVLLEEATSSTFVRDKDDAAQGVEASNEIEKLAQEEAARILEGPRAPRARFTPVSALSDPDDPSRGRALGKGVQIARVQTEHDSEPISRGRAYVYFWPGGLTEHAAI